MKRFACIALAALAAFASALHALAAPVATGSIYDIADPGLLPTADNILAGKVPERTAGTYTGTWYESLPASLACVTDGAIPNQGSDCNAFPDARALMDIDGTLTWTWDAAESVKDVRLYTQWGDGWRCDVSVKSIELRIGGTWTALANSAFDYSFMSDWNTVAQYDGDQSHKTRRVVFADSDPDANLANAATGLRITFGDQCFNNGSLGYGAYWEIEATRGVSGDDLTFEVMNTVNGGADYTGLGEVAVKRMPIVAGYEEYQFTVGDAQPAADGWQAYTAGDTPADVIAFALPQTLDAEITVHCRLRGDGLADLDLTDTIKSAYGAQPTASVSGGLSVLMANTYDGAPVTAAQILALNTSSDSHGGIVSVTAQNAVVRGNTNLVLTVTNLAGNSASCNVPVTATIAAGTLPQSYLRTLLHLGANFDTDDLKQGNGTDYDYLQGFGGERNILPHAGQTYTGLTTSDTTSTPGTLVWTVATSDQDRWVPKPPGFSPPDYRDYYLKYWHIYIISPDERDIYWRYESDDDTRVFVNGELQLSTGYGGGSAAGHLNAGLNSVTIKFREGGGGDYMQLAIRRDTDGNYFDDLEYRLDPGFVMADASTGSRFTLSSGQARIAAIPRVAGYTRYQVFQDNADGTAQPGETWTAYDPDAVSGTAIPYTAPAILGDDVYFAVVLSDDSGQTTRRETCRIATFNAFGSLSVKPFDTSATVSGTATLAGSSGTAVLRYGTNASSLDGSKAFPIAADGSFSSSISNLLAGTTYYWEVEIDEGGAATGSGSGSFRTLAYETFGNCAVVNGSPSSDGSDAVITFTESGRIRFPKAVTLDVLLVGGGGGGGNGGYSGGGGGGAGGVVYRQEVSLPAGEYNVTVGTGGAENEKGADSVFAGYRAYGGGAGNHGYGDPNETDDGGSGGGASAVANWERVAGTGTEGQGHDGGRNLRTAVLAAAQNGDVEATVVKNASGQEFNGGGGGGGAGAPGGSGSFIVKEYREDNGVYTAFCDYYYAGNGGDGIACSITGEELWYGGGGGGGLGGWYRNGSESSGGKGGGGKGGTYNDWAYDGDPTHGFKRNGEDGVDGTGGGGGGGGSNGNENSASNGGRGGSGIVIVRFTQRFADDSNVGTGGTISKKDGYMIHTFTEDGTFEIPNSTYAEILVVGGGGGGGEAVYGGGGGGGAGGFVHHANYPLLAGTYPVRVGAGGTVNMPGGDSALGGLVAYGGGAGNHGYSDPYDGNNGGSGGGAAGINNYQKAGGTGISGQGHDGGANLAKTVADQNLVPEGYSLVNGFTQGINAGGGGGGAGAPGGGGRIANAVVEEDGKWFRTNDYWPGEGGDGLPCSITGEEVWYAGGGGGGQFGWYRTEVIVDGGRGGGGKGGAVNDENYQVDGEDGEDGTGGGGGGGGDRGDAIKSHGGSGGSGIVIVRYKLRPRATMLLVR